MQNASDEIDFGDGEIDFGDDAGGEAEIDFGDDGGIIDVIADEGGEEVDWRD